ncbi:MAG: transposase [Bacteroidetes bacterium]|nr:transposase [Bacteroidota bacterium]
MEHSHLKRLDRIWIENPIYFITACTENRNEILTNPQAAAILIEEWKSAKERHDWYVGRYVIMPDHVHFFCVPGNEAKDLSRFMKSWKEWTSKRIKKVCNLQDNLWQPEFFDHLLRNEESYCQKWDYVLNNPVREGLVKNPNEWRWQGEIDIL